MHCNSCGKPIVEGSTFCRYCGASQQATESASSDMASIAGVFQEIEDEKRHEPTYQEFRRSHSYLMFGSRSAMRVRPSYLDYQAWMSETKRDVVKRRIGIVVVWVIVIVLAILAMTFIFHMG